MFSFVTFFQNIVNIYSTSFVFVQDIWVFDSDSDCTRWVFVDVYIGKFQADSPKP